MASIYQSRTYDFAHDAETDSLVFRWTPATEDLSDWEFKEGLSNFAGYAFEFGVESLVVDLREFRASGITEQTANTWRAEVVVPRYNRAGVKKFAYLTLPDAPGPPVGGPVRHLGEEFETAVFDAEAAMLEWLRS